MMNWEKEFQLLEHKWFCYVQFGMVDQPLCVELACPPCVSVSFLQVSSSAPPPWPYTALVDVEHARCVDGWIIIIIDGWWLSYETVVMKKFILNMQETNWSTEANRTSEKKLVASCHVLLAANNSYETSSSVCTYDHDPSASSPASQRLWEYLSPGSASVQRQQEWHLHNSDWHSNRINCVLHYAHTMQ